MVYIDDCPVNKLIPVFLIALGVISLLILVGQIVAALTDKFDYRVRIINVQYFVYFIFMGWVITGISCRSL